MPIALCNSLFEFVNVSKKPFVFRPKMRVLLTQVCRFFGDHNQLYSGFVKSVRYDLQVVSFYPKLRICILKFSHSRRKALILIHQRAVPFGLFLRTCLGFV